MGISVERKFYGLAVFIWLLSVLTLSISGETKTDGNANTSSTSTLNTSFIDRNSKTENQVLPSKNLSASEPVDHTQALNKNVATPSVAGEGGPISIISPTQQASSATFHLNNTNSLDVQGGLSNEEANIPYVRRKGTSKIVSRKGANELPNITDKNTSLIETAPSSDVKVTNNVVSSTMATVIHNNEGIDKGANISKANNTLHTVSQKALPVSVPAKPSTIQEHKPKPTATIIDPNSDTHEYIPHSKGPRLGMPKKIDYVLPVVVTLIALPVLGAIIFMVYKQGRDYWDKRHYRRMDFLIDGMYND